MDTTVHTPFCIPLRQRSCHAAAKPGDEGGIPSRPLSSSQSHSSRVDSWNEGCIRSSTAIDVPPTKVDTFTTFVSGALQRDKSQNEEQTKLAKVPVSVSQSMVISCDNSKSFVLKSIIPYVQQTTTLPKTSSEPVHPSVPSPAHLISGSLATNQTLSLPQYTFSVPTTNVTSAILPHGPYYDRATDDSFCKNQDSLLTKEMLHEGHCCENAPRRLRLKTMDGPSYGSRSNYGRPGWQDGPRQSTLPYPGSGASRFYTKPAPSLPLLPLGQAYGRATSRRLIFNNFPESHWWVFIDVLQTSFAFFKSSKSLIPDVGC
ncbi:unnamed protein product [Wuchereria bancrofti]|uniref:Uncharacterized protein n=1 Tax=Wuchereria bancrofti TaxID=6293 RepID=A0A3P7E8L0_WUCBA|nr:unnamed protein product [Wuchereria bancrofti]